MAKLIKYCFIGLFVLVGLYFFGDFRINDVNVRDYLQQRITVENINKAKQGAVGVFNLLQKVVVGLKQVAGNLKSPGGSSGTDANETVGTVTLSQTGGDEGNAAGQGKPMEVLSSKDRQQLMNLLKNNLETLPENSNQVKKAGQN